MNKLNSEQKKFLKWLKDVDLHLIIAMPELIEEGRSKNDIEKAHQDADFLYGILTHDEYLCISKILERGEYTNSIILDGILNKCKGNKTLMKYWKLYINN